MKKVIEVRRSEVNAAKADANPSSPNSEVSAGHWGMGNHGEQGVMEWFGLEGILLTIKFHLCAVAKTSSTRNM